MSLVIRDLEQRELLRRHPDLNGGRILRTRLTGKGDETFTASWRAVPGQR